MATVTAGVLSANYEETLKSGKINILKNWDFRNPVNQRGQSSYSITSNEYSIDRWKGSSADGTVAINSGSISLTSIDTGFEFGQKLENYTLLNGKTLTASVDVGGTIYSGTATVDTDSNSTPISVLIGSTEYSLQLRIIPASSIFTVRLIAGGGGITLSDIRRIKLEIGSVSTLAYDPPADYGEQLALCQRFAIALEAMSYRAVAYDTNTITFIIPTPVTLRTNPTLSVAPTVYTMVSASQSGFTFAYTALSNGIKVVATKATHELTDAKLVVSACVASAEL